MDTLGALALATEPPTDILMDRTPVGRRLEYMPASDTQILFCNKLFCGMRRQLMINLHHLKCELPTSSRTFWPFERDLAMLTIYRTHPFLEGHACFLPYDAPYIYVNFRTWMHGLRNALFH